MIEGFDVVYYDFHNCKIPSETYIRELVQDYIWAREARGDKISIRQLSIKMGISDRTLSRWLKGEHSILYSNLEKIIDYLSSIEEKSWL